MSAIMLHELQELMLGIRFIWQVKHGGTFDELEGTKRQNMEWHVHAHMQQVESYV